MIFFYFIIFICQYLYINYIFKKHNPKIVKSVYKYTLENTKEEQTATIYRTNRSSKKVILFFSGAFLLEYHFYISKLMYDLECEYESIMSNYELICYEKTNKTSFDIYDDVYNYISHLDKEFSKIEELILFGFSAGGVVASHVMEKCKNMTCKKIIITYDTPWQVHHNVDSFKNNWVYRFDILFFWKVFNVYSNHYNYQDIKHHLKDKKWYSGSDEINQLIKDIHNCSNEEFLKMTGFNFDQTNDTKVYNIYSRKDIFAIHKISDIFVEKNKDKIKFFNKNIEKNRIGHCSDMAFSTDYLMDIIIILLSNELL
jgi:predicted alpha/beta-fold hydrolase